MVRQWVIFLMKIVNLGGSMEKEYIEKIIENEQRSKSNLHRINEHEEQIKELSNVYVALTKVDDKVAVAAYLRKLTNKVTNVENDVSEMKSDLKEMKEKPLREYEDSKKQVRNAVLAFLVGIICTFVAIKLGLGQYL